MGRRLRLTTWYARRARDTVQPGTPTGIALGRVVRNLLRTEVLPGSQDFEARRRPTGRAWVRRVPGHNLWLWYRFDETEVFLLALTADPPVPTDTPEGPDQ
ncbi:MAG: hypothetical protein AAF447_00985 [Myxococcota bacterium]